MKRTILTLICSLCILVLYAQTKTTLEKLEGKWVMQFPSKNPAVVEYLYTKETITETTHLLGHHLEKTRPYYVSDEMVEEFDSTKIGKYPNGKYIMTYFKKGNQKPELEVRHEEILELSDTLLVIKNLYNNVILTYKKDKSYIISEIINHYLTDKTFYEYDNTYQCDLDEKTRWVTLYNKDNQYTYVDHYDRYTGKQITIEESQNGGEQLEPDNWTRAKCYSIINSSFSKEEKERIKNRAITILLYVNPDTGKIAEVEFQFPNFNPFTTIPVSVYRQIEVELKNNVWFTPTEEGKRRNYILRAWRHKVQ